MKRNKPPFRADHVGSFLRSTAIKEAREKHEKGQISDADLKQVEDQEIPKVVKKQEEAGLQCATDGEYRRADFRSASCSSVMPIGMGSCPPRT